MGTFMGHIVPGSFFLLFGAWVIIQTFRRYYASRHQGNQFLSTHTFLCSCLCGKFKEFPLDPLLKILASIVGFIGEIITGFQGNESFTIGNGDHATIYFFFALSGIVDILTHYRVQIPTDVDYVFSVVALFIEGLLLNFHLRGRTGFEVRVHTLLTYVIFLNTLAVMVEMKYRCSVLPPLSRGFFYVLQGTWFWQIAFVLYSPVLSTRWKANDEDELQLITMIFTWHAGADLLLTLSVGLIIGAVYRRRGYLLSRETDELPMKSLLHHKSNGQTIVRLGSEDDDSDLEFQAPVR